MKRTNCTTEEAAYAKIADSAAESLFDDHLELETLLPAIAEAVHHTANGIVKCGDDYDIADIVWAQDQVREAKLFLESLGEIVSHLEAGISQSLPIDDQIIIGHMRSASALASNLKRRLDVKWARQT